MKLLKNQRWIIFEIILFLIALVLFFTNKTIGNVALFIWAFFLVGIPFCISEIFKNNDNNGKDKGEKQ